MVLFKDISKNSLTELFYYLNGMRMEYRKKLNLPDFITFGNEIEVNDIILDDAKAIVKEFNSDRHLSKNDSFDTREELTCDSEIVTPIMTDSIKYWDLLYDMYLLLDNEGATFSYNTSSHVHMGTKCIDSKEKLSLLLKTLVVFEPIIFKFGYGRDDLPREYMTYMPHGSNYSMIMSPKRVRDFLEYLDRKNIDGKELNAMLDTFLNMDIRVRSAFNFRQFNFPKLYSSEYQDAPDHMEFRNFNSADPIVVQNNIDLCGHIFLAVVNGKIDKEYVKAEYEKYKKKRYCFDEYCGVLDVDTTGAQYNRILNGYNKVKLDKAFKLADMIFDDDISKFHFLKQYLKLYHRDDEYIKSLEKKN